MQLVTSMLRTSEWWSSDKETFEGRSVHSLMTSAGYTQLIDQSTHVINIDNSSSCIDLIFASNPNVTCNLGVKLSLFDKCHHKTDECKALILDAKF